MSNKIFIKVFKFLGLLLKEWVIWVALVLDLLLFCLQILIPRFSLPHPFYLLIAIIGIVWAAYKINDDLQKMIPQEISLRELISKIELSFVEGNEYYYRFQKWDSKRKTHVEQENLTYSTEEPSFDREKTLPWTVITLIIRIENIGETPIKILTVSGNTDFIEPFKFMLYECRDLKDYSITFPVELKCKEVLLFKLFASIKPSDLLTDAQIAARMKNLINERVKTKSHVDIEFTNPQGKIIGCSNSILVSLLPLCDLYLGHWSNFGREDLINLSK